MLLNIRNMMKFVFYLGTVWLRSFKHLFILDSLNVLRWMGVFFWLKYLKCTLIVWLRSLVFGMSWRHSYAFIVNVRRFNGYFNCVWKTIWMTIKVGFRWNNRCWDNKYTGHKTYPAEMKSAKIKRFQRMFYLRWALHRFNYVRYIEFLVNKLSNKSHPEKLNWLSWIYWIQSRSDFWCG